MTPTPPSLTALKNAAHTKWEDVHARLRQLGEYLAGAGEPGPAEQERVLRERAELLSRKLSPPAAERSIELVTFALAGTDCAIEARFVKEAQVLKEITSLPGLPETIAGIFNHRGRLRMILDLKSLLGLPQMGLSDFHTVLVLDSESLKLALLVDRLTGIRTLPARELQPRLATMGTAAERLLLGISPDGMAVFDGTKLPAEAGRQFEGES